uniref:Vesicle transport protein n=1 Tax=Macrostomum lignano TaxID=282301 RepID=A0A1I8FFA2_9PLAT
PNSRTGPVPAPQYGWVRTKLQGAGGRASESLLPLFNRGDAATSSSSSAFHRLRLLASSASSSSLCRRIPRLLRRWPLQLGDHLAGAAAGMPRQADDPSSGASPVGLFRLLQPAVRSGRAGPAAPLPSACPQAAGAGLRDPAAAGQPVPVPQPGLPAHGAAQGPPVCRLYSMGSLCLLLSFSALWGPVNHLRHLVTGPRRPFTCAYLLMLAATLYSAMGLRSGPLALLFVCLQVAALLWYLISYLPGGQRASASMDDIVAWVRTGNAVQVRLWLENTENENDLNQGDDHRFSLLHWAAWDGQDRHRRPAAEPRRPALTPPNMGATTRRCTSPPLAATTGSCPGCSSSARQLTQLMSTATRRCTTPASSTTRRRPLTSAAWSAWRIATARHRWTWQARPGAPAARHLARELGQEVEMRQPQTTPRRRWARRPGAQPANKNPTLSRQPGIQYEAAQTCAPAWPAGNGTELWRGHLADQDTSLPGCSDRGPQAAGSTETRIQRAAAQTAHLQQHHNVLPVLSAVISDSSACAGHGFALDIAKAWTLLTKLEQLLHHFQLNSKHVERTSPPASALGDCRFVYHQRAQEYRPLLDVARGAAEARGQDINTTAAFMWSFGILLWELETREVPFGSLGPMEAGIENRRRGPPISLHGAGLLPSTPANSSQLATNEEAGRRPRFDNGGPDSAENSAQD